MNWQQQQRFLKLSYSVDFAIAVAFTTRYKIEILHWWDEVPPFNQDLPLCVISPCAQRFNNCPIFEYSELTTILSGQT